MLKVSLIVTSPQRNIAQLFYDAQLYRFGSLSLLSSLSLPATAGSHYQQKKLHKPTVRDPLSSKQQTDAVGN